MQTLTDGIRCLPLRTPTLPPATHTNTWLLGEGSLLVVDPASPYDDERQRLITALDTLADDGEQVEALFLTHHHHDHVSGAVHLQQHLAARGRAVPIIAHPATATLLAGKVDVDVLWNEGDRVELGGRLLEVFHTPGHAPGHLVLLDDASGHLVAGDMVAGVGTIAIDPDEGDLGDYLAHLERLIALAPTALLPAHGPALHEPTAVLSGYIAHRNGRSEQIRQALVTYGPQTPEELAPRIYPELPAMLHPLAARQILTHLRWLADHGVSREEGGRWRE